MGARNGPSKLLAPAYIRELAGDGAFRRGEGYLADGAVRSLRERGDGVEARVRGTREYRVRLWVEDGELEYDCTCPVGEDGDFCKHCVAVALAWGAGRLDDAAGGSDAPDEADLRAHLLSLDKEALVALVLAQADDDEALRRRLTIGAAGTKGAPAQARAWKDALADALDTGSYVPYAEAHGYADGIEEVIDSLGDMLGAGQAESVISLAEHAIAEVEECIGSVDDSDGWMGGLLHKLQEIHLEACRAARPDPSELAERLFEWEMETDYDTFYRAAETYAEVLGDVGRAVYVRLAEAEWAKVPANKPGDSNSERFGRYFRITSIMETLARSTGDVEALVAVKSRDLSVAYSFLQIAEVYREAGDPARALDWAERGWRAFPEESQDHRLREFLAAAYQDQGRHEEAIALAWQAFAASPSLGDWRLLKKHAKRARRWDEWRAKALALIRERPAEKRNDPPPRLPWLDPTSYDRSLLVEVFLEEGDADSAWQEARDGGCSTRLWLDLAARREKSHPADAVDVYRDHVARLLRETGNRVYEDAVRYLAKIEALSARLGEPQAFRALIVGLRAEQRRKRNLMAMLDAKGWTFGVSP